MLYEVITPLEMSLGGLCRTGIHAGPAVNTPLSIDLDTGETKLFEEPRIPTEGTDKLTERAIDQECKEEGKGKGYGDRPKTELEAEEIEGVDVMVDDLV